MKVARFVRLAILAGALVCSGVSYTVAAPLSYTGGSYTQNFNGLPTNTTPAQTLTGRGPHEFGSVTGTTGMDGWQLSNPSGSSTNTEFRSHNGSGSGATGRGVISFGPNGNSDRALGTLATSNQISSFGLVLVNNSSQTFGSFTLSYTGEQWRRGEDDLPEPNSLDFSYAVGATSIATSSGTFINFAALTFTAPNTQVSPSEVAIDGNAVGNKTAISATVTGLNWAPGQRLVLRWLGEDLQGQDDGIGIDDLSFSTQVVPEPSSIILAGLGAIGLALAAIRRRARR